MRIWFLPLFCSWPSRLRHSYPRSSLSPVTLPAAGPRNPQIGGDPTTATPSGVDHADLTGPGGPYGLPTPWGP
jgi:hypothetical protein